MKLEFNISKPNTADVQFRIDLDTKKKLMNLYRRQTNERTN